MESRGGRCRCWWCELALGGGGSPTSSPQCEQSTGNTKTKKGRKTGEACYLYSQPSISIYLHIYLYKVGLCKNRRRLMFGDQVAIKNITSILQGRRENRLHSFSIFFLFSIFFFSLSFIFLFFSSFFFLFLFLALFFFLFPAFTPFFFWFLLCFFFPSGCNSVGCGLPTCSIRQCTHHARPRWEATPYRGDASRWPRLRNSVEKLGTGESKQ